MKKLLYFIVFFTLYTSYSQEKTIPAGEYTTLKSQYEKVNITLLDNKRYSISVFSGVYEQKNDSIYFKSDQENEAVFKLEYSYEKTNSKKININFEGLFINYSDGNFIGVQETATSAVTYKSVQEFTNFNANDYDETKKYQLEINPCYALYFVKENENYGSIIEKFILPNNLSQINVFYNKSVSNPVNLTGYYDTTTKQLSIGANGRNILQFELNPSQTEKSKYEIPSEKNIEKKWTYAGKKPALDYYGQTVDSSAVATDYAEPTTPNYTFKLKIENSLKDAFATFKKGNDKSRFLVLVNNINYKNRKQDFDDFIKTYQENINYSMYDGYNAVYDRFDFYLITDKDKSSLKKYGINENTSVSFFNSDGVKLYYSDASINDELFSYYNLTTVNLELKTLDANAKFDASFSNPKASTKEIITVLYETSNQEVPYRYDSTVPVISDYTPPVAIDVIKEVPAQEEPPKVMTYENKITETVVETVDTTAAYVDTNYNFLKIEKNKYQSKSNYNQVNDKWLKILETHKQDKVVIKNLALVILKELTDKGFNKIIFNKNNEINSKINQLEIEYLLNNYDSIVNFSTVKDSTTTLEYDNDYYTLYNIKETISNSLNKSFIKENLKNKDDLNKGIERYKNLVKLTNNDENIVSYYMSALKENNFETEFLKAYENYYNSIIKDNSSIVEQLDSAFAIKQLVNYSENWVEFKYNFANQANDAAWYVVEKVKDETAIKKAIEWSETSLKIQKDDFYYLDTLAQLYYKNGEKDRAIATEEKAISKLAEDNTTQREEYQNVLEKMKNGTY